MATITVWLLVFTGSFAGTVSGAAGGVQPFMFPTQEACAKVAEAAQVRFGAWRCVQTVVLK